MDEHGESTEGLTLDEFIQLVAGHFELDAATIRPESLVTADLGLDSIGVFEMVMIVEDLGVDLSDEQLERLGTVQDWYDAYRLGLPTT